MIGIFDSGLGGLTIAKEIFKQIPQYQIIYLGDTAHLPYGNHSPEMIYKLTQKAIGFLFSQGAELIIVACATATSAALRRIQQEYLPLKYPQKRVLGVVIPLAEEAVKATKNKRVGVVGTRRTISSLAFSREIIKLNKNIKVFEKTCPLLVPLIEEGWAKKPETRMILKKYLIPLKMEKIDTLVLGCTHYPLIFDDFKRKMGKSCQVLNSSEVVVKSLADYFKRHSEIEKKLKKGDKHQFFVTDLTTHFRELAGQWLGRKVDLELVEMDEL